MSGTQPSTLPPGPPDKANGGTLDKQSNYGLKNKKAHNSFPQKLKKVPNKTNLHNQMDSFFPGGIPKSALERSTKLVYDWERTKNKERNDRDPVTKPLALPVDDEYLSVLPSDSGNVAWMHLKSDKKRPSLEDFNNRPEPVQERHTPAKEETKFTETANALLIPAEMQPTPRHGKNYDGVPEANFKDAVPIMKTPCIPQVWTGCCPPPQNLTMCPSTCFYTNPVRQNSNSRGTEPVSEPKQSHPFYVPDQCDYNMYARAISILPYKIPLPKFLNNSESRELDHNTFCTPPKPVSRRGALTRTLCRPVVECFRPWKP